MHISHPLKKTITGITAAHPGATSALPAPAAERLMSPVSVMAIIDMSKSWLYDAVRHGRFPAPVIRGVRCTRWKASDVDGWIREQCATAGNGVAV
jgi:prophage regulatory protein